MRIVRRAWIGIAIVVIVALALRLVGLGWGLPGPGRYLSWNPDESTFTTALAQMNPSALDFNPRQFGIPSFTPYALAAGLLAGRLLGLVEIQPDRTYYATHLEQWGRVFLTGRVISVAFALLSVVVMAVLLRRLYPDLGRGLPLLGAAFLAIAPGHVAWSHYLSQNPLVTFWVLVTFVFLVAVVEKPTILNSLLAGLFSGVAFSTNYNALPLLLLLPLAHLLAWWPFGRACGRAGGRAGGRASGPPYTPNAWWPFGRAGGRAGGPPYAQSAWSGLRRLALSAIAAVVGFVAVTPYAVLDFPTFWHWITWVNRNLAGDVGLLESVRRLFLDVLPATIGWGPYLLGLVGIGWTCLARRRRPAEWLAPAFLALFALMVARSGHRLSVGRLLPMAVLLLAPAAGVIGAVWDAGMWGRGDTETRRHGDAETRGRLARVVMMAAVVLALGTALIPTLAVDVYFVRDTVRADASAWIVAHIPPGATVGTIYEPWYFTPDILGLDYFHPEATGGLYHHQVYEYDADRLRETPADWLVVASQELGSRLEESSEPTREDFRAYLENRYRRVAGFALCERIGWACAVLESQPALFSSLWPAPDVWVYQHDVR